AAPAASTPTASAPTLAASVPGGDINQALQRITGQMETLTRIIDRHTTVLTAHETRLQRMEDYLAKPISERDKAALPLPKAQP
ncbi:MAG: hypothetical protein JO110_06420, partial [Acetobacteraceae bacterium]|nr:hypothetical protein [Acetobacteraceae bacterium]